MQHKPGTTNKAPATSWPRLRKNMVLAARIANIAVLVVLCCAAVIVAAAAIIDRVGENTYFAAGLVRFLLGNNISALLFLPAGWMARLHLVGIFGFAILCALAAGLAIGFLKALPRTSHKTWMVVSASISSMIFSFILLLMVAVLFVNMMLMGYVNKVFSNGGTSSVSGQSYISHLSLMEEQLQDTSAAAEMALRRMMSDVEGGLIELDSLTDAEYKAIARQLCYLIDRKGGVYSRDEHYFRNNFSRAPATLEEMVQCITQTPNTVFGWRLMPPKSTYLHMQGENGEYNLKFLSADGIFEAVYNKDGMLLTAETGPDAMGTFNYADSVTRAHLHSVYDVMPYFTWGNVLFEGAPSRDILSNMRNKYNKNPDAKAHYAHYKQLLG